MKLNNKSGFTLIEIVIVLIIIAILAVLALPKYGSMIATAKVGEAIQQLMVTSEAVERCKLLKGGTSYTNCVAMSSLDIDDPANDSQAHFSYALATVGANGYSIIATRNTVGGADAGSTHTIGIFFDGSTKTRGGTGVFSGYTS